MLKIAMAGALLAVSVPAMAQTGDAPVAHAGDDLPVDARNPAALVKTLHEMGYEANLLSVAPDGWMSLIKLSLGGGRDMNLSLFACPKGDNCKFLVIRTSFVNVAAKPEWLAKINGVVMFGKVSLDPLGRLNIDYPMIPQGMPRANFRETIAAAASDVGVVFKSFRDAGLVQTPPAPAKP